MAFHPQPLLFLVLGLAAGTLVAGNAASIELAIALVLAAMVSVIAIVAPARASVVPLVAAAAAAGSAFATAARAEDLRHALPDETGRVEGAVILEGQVANEPGVVDDEIRFDLAARRIVAEEKSVLYTGRIRVYVRMGKEETPNVGMRKGDAIRLWAELRVPQPVRSPGGFDQAEWARREGIHAFASCKSVRLITVVTRAPESAGLLDRTRERLRRSWRHVRDEEDRAVTASTILGDENALSGVTRDEFRSAGLLHLLVVSGSQIAALIAGLRRAFSPALRLSWTGWILECAVVISYCRLAGAEDSMVRATVMAIAFGLAVRVDLGRGGLNFLWGAALVLLAARPLDALDPGTQLSFAATAALVMFAGGAGRRLEAWRVPPVLAEIVAAAFVATIATAPLTLFWFHRFSVIGLAANVLAAPLAVLLLYASLLTAVADAFSSAVAGAMGVGCGAIAATLRALAHHAALLDPDWRGPAPPLALLAGTAALFLCDGWRKRALPLAGLVACLSQSGLPTGDGRLHAWFLDVGQGDAALIETPRGLAVAIDAGPAFGRFDAGERVVSEALWALGHRRLQALVVTHRHSDHEGGASFLVSHFAPQAIHANGPSRALPKSVVAKAGDAWEIDGVHFRVLNPGNDLERDENERSLVLQVGYGRTEMLLMGDAGTRTESHLSLHDSYALVKVGHHGAATSSSPRFVAATRPRIAVISVGTRNRFAHPSADVVKRWKTAGSAVWRTDRDATLHLASDGDAITFK